jgi:hypothetical protein
LLDRGQVGRPTVREGGLRQPPRSPDFAELRARFAEQLASVEAAAREWGVRPDYPEAIFISSMIGTQGGFADIALSVAEALDGVVREARATATEELARQRVVTEETRYALGEASAAVANMKNGAKVAIQQIEAEKTAAMTKLITSIVPEMVRGVREAVVIKERRYNHAVEWMRGLGIGALMLSLVLGGFVWGTWSDWGLTARIENIGSAIERCQLTSRWADDKGKRLCEMDDFVRN